jgi:hypothetical protein
LNTLYRMLQPICKACDAVVAADSGHCLRHSDWPRLVPADAALPVAARLLDVFDHVVRTT